MQSNHNLCCIWIIYLRSIPSSIFPFSASFSSSFLFISSATTQWNNGLLLNPSRKSSGKMDKQHEANKWWTSGKMGNEIWFYSFFVSQLQKAYRKKGYRWIFIKVRYAICSEASYQVTCYRLRDNRVREITNSWEPGTGYIWGGKFTIVTGCHVRSASLVCHDVRKSCSRRYHKEFIFLYDLKKNVFNHSCQNVTASSHEEAAW